MDWLTQMNEALDYIESHLTDEIDLDEIGRITACPAGLFQRIFPKIIGIPLSEYIRRRKLTLAAYDLQVSDCKVVDVAMKYGYETADAFTVAFKRMHGINPAAVKENGVSLKAYPRLTFTLLVKGVTEMNYRIEEKEDIRTVGVVIKASQENNPIPDFWGECYENGTAEKLCKTSPGKPLIGICCNMNNDGTFNYMIGIETTAAVPDGMSELIIPKSTWAIFESVGPMPEAIQNVWQRIYSEFLPQGIYSHAGTPDLEVYFEGDNSASDYRCEVWIPVVEK